LPQDHVIIFDTTLRDGEQSPGFTMGIEEKLMMARQLERLGVDVIEAGFPISSKGDFEAVERISAEIKQCEIAALARTKRDDIERAYQAIRSAAHPRIHIFVSTSDIHLVHQLRKTREEVMKMAVEAVRLAKSFIDDVEFSPMDATRSDRNYLCKVVESVIEAGSTTVNIPDTVGYCMPWEFASLIKHIQQHVRGIEKTVLSVHCHNDLGLATSNSLIAILEGARQVECTVNGIGERAGNASLEEIAMSIKARQDLLQYHTSIRSEQIYPASRLLAKITGVNVQPNKAIVGRNAFSHESGIHQDGVLKHRTTYEIITPESVGISKSSLVLGKHSGRHAFLERLKDLGFTLDGEQIEQAFRRFKILAEKKTEIFDEDMEAIVTETVIRAADKFKLTGLTVVCGTAATPIATVSLQVNETSTKGSEFGDGPVDATFKAIRNLTRTKSRFLSYSVNSITGGTDAQGEVTVRLEENGNIVTGQGAHEDIIMASAMAYLNALNRLAYLEKNPVNRIPRRHTSWQGR
jgi:2-isopropylmalate synthase